MLIAHISRPRSGKYRLALVLVQLVAILGILDFCFSISLSLATNDLFLFAVSKYVNNPLFLSIEFLQKSDFYIFKMKKPFHHLFPLSLTTYRISNIFKQKMIMKK